MKAKVTTDAKHGEARIFKNQFLESLTKTTASTNAIYYGLFTGGLIALALIKIELPVLQFIGLFVAGILFWTLAEYLLHRYLFHWVTDHPWSQRFHFIMHGAHHEYPRDKDRLLMPPVPGTILATLLFGVFYVVFYLAGIPKMAFGFFPGFFLGYLAYSFVHRATHIMKPPKRFKKLWLHHSLHHYKYPDKAFGVSNRFWDRVFGTMPPK